jgi:PAS domain S-box-containing protein
MNPLTQRGFSDGLMPHGFCYQWKPVLVWLHAVSDTLIALAYFLIPVALIHLARKRRDIPFGWMFICFSVFIAACGGTHVMDVWTLWVPSYWLSAGVKVVTALATLPTAVFLARFLPQILSLPSANEMRAANEELVRQDSILKRSEERFREMAENIQEIFWTMDPKTKEATYISPAFESICEQPLETVYSNPTSYRELIHPDDRQRVLAGLERLEKSNLFDEEFRIVCPSGTVKWLRGIGFQVRNPEGIIHTLVGTAHEITERKEMELALRRSEDLFRDLVEHSSDLICTYNLEGRLLHVNELPARVLGYSREDLLDKPMREFLLPEKRAQFDESLLAIQRDGFVKGLMVVLTKTGEHRIWEYHNTLRTDGVSTPIVRGIAHDVTEQKRMERALRLSEEKFSKAFLASPYAIVISTMDEGRLIDVNDSFLRIMGFTRDETIGHTSFELRIWNDSNDRNAILGEIERTGRVQARQIPFQNKWGKQVVVNYSAEVIELRGQRRLLSVCEDVTERKLSEEQLRLAQARIESILTSVAETHVLFDRNWHYLYVNEAAVRALGRPREEILRLTLWEVHPDVVGTEIDREFRRAMDRRGPVVFEFHYESVGTWWENRLYPAPEGLAVFATDITERKRAEARLREYEKAVEGVEEMIAVVDLEYRYLLANQAFVDFRRMKKEQVVGHLVPEVLGQKTFEGVVKNKMDQAFQGNIVKYEMEYNYPQVGRRDVLVSYFPLEGVAGIDRVVCVLQDITERKRSEEELGRLSGELLRLQDEERRKIARDLHDTTGQDLVALAATLSQVRAAIPASSRKFRKQLSHCRAVAEKSLREVRTLSYLLHPPMLDEAGLADAICHFATGFAERSGIRVNFEVSPHFGRLPQSSELGLFRIVQESLTNIQRHSGSDTASIHLNRERERVMLEVRDTGRGIPVAKRKQNGFYQTAAGVGIPSMEERVKQVGGQLDIESNGRGTIVRVSVPLYE